LTLEDLEGRVDLVAFPRVWKAHQEALREGKTVLIRGRLDTKRGEPTVLINEVSTTITVRQTAVPEPEEEAALPASEVAEPVAAYRVAEPEPSPAAAAGNGPVATLEPAAKPRPNGGGRAARPRRRLVLHLRPGQDVDAEARRLRRLHETLIAFPGQDAFAFQVHLEGGAWRVDFPQASTHIGPELETRLRKYLRQGERWHIVEAATPQGEATA